ncbi:neural proliferation differentiation and control protein 1 [Indicator indicator]|uniref:neural proliferation differentiation and control protein 1 n=1 Tax=Indicator indicator TaxID=1002788 RepID=UPI0023DF186F|nr:neural proliferation differentiation and control protein 1 [Indicator indicator]
MAAAVGEAKFSLCTQHPWVLPGLPGALRRRAPGELCCVGGAALPQGAQCLASVWDYFPVSRSGGTALAPVNCRRRDAVCVPASCPRSLDCALQRREFCPPGSGACGPCLPPFQEDSHRQCVQKQLSGSGRISVPSWEEEIDFLARQEAPHPQAPRDGKPRTTLVPAGGRQRVVSRLREGLLQWGRASSEAAATLPTSTTAAGQKYPVEASPIPSNDNVVLVLIVVCTVAGISALIVAAFCWCRLQKEVRLAQKADYSAQRAASPLPYDKILPGDKTLAQSAQMYHYQHQKQQMLSMEKHKEEPKLPDSASSDEENEDGDFTVYECPGLAPTGEMEVRNPLFDDNSLHPSNPKSHQ